MTSDELIEALKATAEAGARHVIETMTLPEKLAAVVVTVGSGVASVVCSGATVNIDVVVPANVTVVRGQKVWVEFPADGGTVIVAAF